MKRLRDERGQVMVLTVLCMAVLLGFVAFAVDMGILLLEKRELQSAVDAAAIAGAAEVGYSDIGNAAQTDAKQNGVDSTVAGTTVTVNSQDSAAGGPTSGPHACPSASCSSYVEVIATRATNTFFMNAFELLANHVGLGSMTVSARAVAGALPSPYCIYTLSPSPPAGMGISLSNGASLSGPNCGILEDASGGSALNLAAGTAISARTIGVVGGVVNGGSITPTPTTGINPVGDPLSFLTPPANPGGCVGLGVFGGSPTFPPGCYNSLTIGGTANVTFQPGTYYINGPLTITTTGSVSGSDVTFYFSPTGSFTLGGVPPYPTLNLSASTSGPYSGVLFYQDPSNTQTMTLTGSGGVMSGVLYLPTGQLSLIAGSAPSSFDISVVAGSISATGNASITLVPYLSPSGTSPLIVPTLTE